MEHLPAFQQMIKKMSIKKLIFEMADFGAPSKKRTILYSSALPCGLEMFNLYTIVSGSDRVDDILRHKTQRNLVDSTQMTKRYVDSSGVQRVCGGRDLKSSQHYPLGKLGVSTTSLFLSLYVSFIC